MRLSFADAWGRLDLTSPVAVSDGTAEPVDTNSLAWRAWRSHNFSGTVAAKLDGLPRVLRIAFDTLVGSLAYDVAESDLHRFELLDPSLDDLRDARWEAVKARRDVAEWSGCETPLGRVDTDPDSQRKTGGAVQMAMIAEAAGAPFSIDWTMQDNSTVTHDAAAMVTMGVAVGQYIAEVHARGVALKAEITAAADAAALAAIDIESGWPT